MAGCTGWLILLAFAAALGYCSSVVEAQFLNGFYRSKGCPLAEAIVTQAVTEAFNKDPSIAPALIRMLFHDCFVEVED